MSRLRLHRVDGLDREIARLAIPALGALVAEPLYLLADTAVVGHLGTPELGGLAVASNLILVVFSLCIFLAYGTTATVARLLGAGDRREAAHQAVQALWLAFGLGVALAAVGLAFAEPLVRIFGASPEVTDLGVLYLRVSAPGLPALLLVLAGTGYLRGLQDTRTPLVVAVVTALGNLVLELGLVYGLGFGLGASALSTVCAQWAGALFYLHRVHRAVRAVEDETGAERVGLGPSWTSLRALARLSTALATRTMALRGALFVGTMVAARLGEVPLAAHEVAFAIWSLLALALDAIAIAGQAMIGHRLGAGDAAGARTAGDRMLWWGLVFGFVFLAVVAALRPVLARVFSSDAEVVALATFLLWFVALLQPVNAIVFVLDGILIGASDLAFLAKAMVGAFAVYLPCALAVLVLDLGVGWLWGAIAVLMLARLVALGARYRGDAWQITGAPTR